MSLSIPLYRRMAELVETIRSIESTIGPASPERPDYEQKREWLGKHRETLLALVKDHMPSGSGFDNGTTLDLDMSSADRLVFTTSFHHMDENGSYDGWTNHTVRVVPSLASEFVLRITGPNRNDIKDYMHDCFGTALRRLIKADGSISAPVVDCKGCATTL